jgi:retron-type reverse transcriptase
MMRYESKSMPGGRISVGSNLDIKKLLDNINHNMLMARVPFKVREY